MPVWGVQGGGKPRKQSQDTVVAVVQMSEVAGRN